jgi:hypothetical protein
MKHLSTILIIIAAPFFQMAALFLFLQMRYAWAPNGPFPETGYNTASIIYLLFTLVGHLLTLLLIGFFIVNRENVPNNIVRICVLLALVALQIFWRGASVGFVHIDCDNSCNSTVIPQAFDNFITIAVSIGLFLTAFMLGLIGAKRIK